VSPAKKQVIFVLATKPKIAIYPSNSQVRFGIYLDILYFCEVFKRISERILKEDLKDFPVVTLHGARQVGKTTLVKQLFEGRGDDILFLDLEKDADRNKLSDAELFLSEQQYKTVVIDEAQAMPEIFRILRPIVDENPAPGRFVLLGSATPSLVKGVSESLAGRTSYVRIHPLSVTETKTKDILQQWLTGGYPKSVNATSQRSRNRWFSGYTESYIHTDINSMFGLSLSPAIIEKLWLMLAHNHANLWNAETFSRSLGISGTTVNRYLEYLQAAFLLTVLQPWHSNLKKRLIKSPKVYLNDSGILHHFHALNTMNDLFGHPICGASWEGFVLDEIIKNLPENCNIHFYRTQNGAECDFVISRGDKVIAACDAKFSNSPKTTRGFLQSLEDLNPESAWLITPYSDTYPVSRLITTISLKDFLGKMKEW
jgi:predicted AAA+ superfamily ATPase